MALMTTIDGIPLYTTEQEAIDWAISNGLSGIHQHIYKEQVGYMGGDTHEIAVTGAPIVAPIPMPTPTPTPIPTTTPTTGGENGSIIGGGGATGGGATGGGY